ncbi:MAG: hypothetical protein K2X29_04840 [Candidatus Obscuribacterales bacterium]|nr:hypothetical protein [Candidatus Obscuribacterales bacterium]
MRYFLVVLLSLFPLVPVFAQYPYQANNSYQGYQSSRPQFIPVAPTQQYQPASPYFPNQVNPAQPGMSSLPPGQYILTNLSTEQAIYVTITPQGQIYTGGPAPTDMAQAQQYANSALQPSQQVQQPQSKFGFLKGLLQDGIGAASSMGY